jgi:hypothetical protein
MEEPVSKNDNTDVTHALNSISSLQGKELAELAAQLGSGRKKLSESLTKLQQSLDYLRVMVKYQLFDLEATRRENAQLRKMLEEDRQ